MASDLGKLAGSSCCAWYALITWLQARRIGKHPKAPMRLGD